MEGNRREEEEIQDDLVVEVVLMVNFPLAPFLFSPFPAAPALMIFLPRRR